VAQSFCYLPSYLLVASTGHEYVNGLRTLLGLEDFPAGICPE